MSLKARVPEMWLSFHLLSPANGIWCSHPSLEGHPWHLHVQINSWALSLLSTLGLPSLSVFHLSKGLITNLCLPAPNRLQNTADHTPPKAVVLLSHRGDAGERLNNAWTS